MRIRNPFRRHGRRLTQLDQTGPATCYPHGFGAYPAPPAWAGPTLMTTVSPLFTPGQRHRAGGIW
ncbi:hypothetical protein [Micromonospora sp. NPDC005172]|uniref:hypothetical protein n=1 Tax=Micromonospora sp. NPDC005172 TaxID=3156867 RepID=UPI0033AA3D05